MRPAVTLAIACLTSTARAILYCAEGCAPGYGFVECDPDGNPVCTRCAADQISFGGYDECLQCAGCSPGHGFVNCSSDVLGTPVCVPCEAGWYGEGAHAACRQCPLDSASSPLSKALDDCLCPYSLIPLLVQGDRAQCMPCPPGTSFTTAARLRACTICPVDYFCTGGNRSAELSPPGFVSQQPGASSPAPCPAGFYCRGGGAMDPCPAGYYCPVGSITPILCPDGTWDIAQGRGQRSDCNQSCPVCAQGFFRSLCAGSSSGFCMECVRCPAGQYQKGCLGNTTSDDSICLACQDGLYSPAGSRACRLCPVGSVPLANASTCLCGKGSYLDRDAGCVPCTECPWGYLNANCSGESGGVCVPCVGCPASHMFLGCFNPPPEIQCFPCPRGLRNAGGYTYPCQECPVCPRGSYQPGCNGTSGPLPCIPCRGCQAGHIFAGCDGTGFRDDGDCAQECPVGQHNTGGYASNCTPCPTAQGPSTPVLACACDPGHYGPTGWECIQCPAGAFCSGGSTPPQKCLAGTWGNTPGQANQSAACPYSCFEDFSCLPGSYPIPDQCGSAAGPMCAPCPMGTFQNTTRGLFCAPCPQGLYAQNSSSGDCVRCPADMQTCYGGLDCPSGSLARHNYSRGERLTWIIRPSTPPGTLKLAVTSADALGRSFRTNSGLDMLSVYTCLEATTACLAQVLTGNLRPQTGWLSTDTGVFVLKWSSRAPGAGLGWEVSWVSDAPPCLPCGPGKMLSSTSFLCDNCMPGTYSSSNTSSTCTRCWPGTFQPSGGASACSACQMGKYQPTRGATSCLVCAPGQYSTTTGASSGDACNLCSAGSYQSYSGNSACLTCAEGRYQPNAGSTACLNCTKCPGGSYQLQACSKTSDDAQCQCPENFYFAPWTCQTCPVCPSGTYLVGCNGTSRGTCQPCRACPPTSYLPGCGGTSPGTVCTPCGVVRCVLGTYLAGCGNISEGACAPCGLVCPPGQYTVDCGFQSPGRCQSTT